MTAPKATDYPLQPGQAALLRQMVQAKQQADRDLNIAVSTALAGHGVVGAFGHVDVQLDESPPVLRVTEPGKPKP